MSTSDPMIRRQATCDRCGRAGVWADTTAGEVVRPDGSVAHAPAGVLLLLATADSPSVLACDDCVDGDGHLLPTPSRVHHHRGYTIIQRVLGATDPQAVVRRLPHAACTSELAERLARAGAAWAARVVRHRMPKGDDR